MALFRRSESKSRRTQVAPSPLNPVKLELALALVLGVSLMIAAPRLVASPLGQLALLGGYGLAAAGWIVWRTRRILRRHEGGEF